MNKRILATLCCAAISGLCGGCIGLISTSASALNFSLFSASVTAFAGALWAYLIFPKMGRSTLADIGIILIAYPAVGFIAGNLHFPILGSSAIYAAIFLPFISPWGIGAFYLVGGLLAWIIPRMDTPLENTSASA